MGSLWAKAKLFKMKQNVRGKGWTFQTNNDGVKHDLFSLQALADNVLLLAGGLQLVSRPCIFIALETYEVYFLLASIELMSSAHSISSWLSRAWHLVQMRSVRWF